MGGGGFIFNCDSAIPLIWNQSASVQSTCPVNEVERKPYPRGLVTVNNQLALQPREWGPAGSGGSWTVQLNPTNLLDYIGLDDLPLVEGLIRRVQLGLRSRRLPPNIYWFAVQVPLEEWHFDDRNSNGGAVTLTGITVTHTYKSSSIGEPEHGRAFDFTRNQPADVYNLPAYEVTLKTFCGHEWQLKWQESVKYWLRAPGAVCTVAGLNTDGTVKPGFARDSCPSGQAVLGIAAFKWVDRTSSWEGLDLRTLNMGLPFPFAIQTMSQEFGRVNNQIYWSATPSPSIWVPIVEVQSVLRAEDCAEGGSCPQVDPRDPNQVVKP